MPDIDPFNSFRWGLAWLVTIYASVITLQSLWGWYAWLAGQDKYIGMLRRYLILHGLRLRFTAFWGDVIICTLLCVVFLMLWHAHHLIYDLGDRLEANRESGHRLEQLEHKLEQKRQPHVEQSTH